MQERNCFKLCIWSYLVLFQSVALTAKGQTCLCVHYRNDDNDCARYNRSDDNDCARYTKDNCRRVNIALNKKAEMSSTHSNLRGLSGPASKANDGNTDMIYRPLNGTEPNCIHTTEFIHGWWQVDLGDVYTISDITIYPRYEYTKRMSDVVITVDDIVCCTIPKDSYSLANRFFISCVSPLTGRVIKLSRNGTLNICEVQVWAWNEGYYGVNYSQKCGNCLLGLGCNASNGVCQYGCEDGFRPPLCIEKCLPGTWGRQCKSKCGKCKGFLCRHDNGSCETGCIPGYEGDLCTVSLDQKSDIVENRAVIGAIIGGSLFVGVSILTAVMIWLRWSRIAQDDPGARSNENNPQCTDAGTNEIFTTVTVNNKENDYDKVERVVEGAKLYTSLRSKKQDDKEQTKIDQDSAYENFSSV